jgi:REP element-mobilizing transposase RayT
MGRPLRHHPAGQTYLVTTRSHQARFFLRPDRVLNKAVLEWLARAQQRYPRLRILAVCVMSNHLHLVVRDDDADLANWASYFFGHLARAVNQIRGRTGSCFERRYSAEPILDDEALIDRLVYVVTNPVQAGLCTSADRWPGILLVADQGQPLDLEVTWIDRDRDRAQRTQAKRRGQKSPAGPVRKARLVVDPAVVAEAGIGGAELRAAITAREQELARDRRRTRSRLPTRKQLVTQDWHAAPRAPKRGPRPLCHASDPEVRQTYLADFLAFVAAFRDACERVLQGEVGVTFPDWCYPPGGRLVRPPAAPA